ncbi:hypothetical protein KT99_06092 [Shewanella benthica KT99]|uniref:Uncharacterized protein n=1 Tax=Shewanella benthica KT99 TaxID=314608 RepID=A9CVN3_9GAMM|nr:hypothetical protein KT99_06092 [Shewanella benthica KT99]
MLIIIICDLVSVRISYVGNMDLRLKLMVENCLPAASYINRTQCTFEKEKRKDNDT